MGAEQSQLEKYALDEDEIIKYHERGFLEPRKLCSPEEMAEIRDRIDEEVFETEGVSGKSSSRESRHLDSEVVWDLVSHPSIVGPMQSILGDDLAIWRSFFFEKQPQGEAGGKGEVPWHQDANYWPIEPRLNISAWIAIDKVDTENGCMQFIPGSHRNHVPHIETPDAEFDESADPEYFDEDDAINIELEPGEFVIFNQMLLHHSYPNRSDRRRLGLATRVTKPWVYVEHDEPPLFEGHENLLLSGEDNSGLNRIGTPPTE